MSLGLCGSRKVIGRFSVDVGLIDPVRSTLIYNTRIDPVIHANTLPIQLDPAVNRSVDADGVGSRKPHDGFKDPETYHETSYKSIRAISTHASLTLFASPKHSNVNTLPVVAVMFRFPLS